MKGLGLLINFKILKIEHFIKKSNENENDGYTFDQNEKVNENEVYTLQTEWK